jgi:hypothetical protein
LDRPCRDGTHHCFGQMLTVHVSIDHAEMRISTSMDSHLVHNLPTYTIDISSEIFISRYVYYPSNVPVFGHRLTGRSSSPKISQASLIRSRILYFASNTLPIVSSWVSKSAHDHKLIQSGRIIRVDPSFLRDSRNGVKNPKLPIEKLSTGGTFPGSA